MAIYRFKVTFEDYDDISREIDVKSNQTFEELHLAIHQATGYNHDYSSSFYISNDQWTKGEEIAYKPNERKTNRGVALMENSKLSNFIDDPHQKFYYVFNFDRPFDFHVELMKILNETPGLTYPSVFKSVGEAPKQFGNVLGTTVIPPTSEEFDFLNEMEFNPEDAEDFSEVKDPALGLGGSIDEEEETHEEEEDEFGNEFSDNEDDDEFGGGRKGGHDDY
jgi:Plasmid pRiA4b ORF-3-like protein